MKREMAVLSIIAVEVVNSNHGNFLTSLAQAWTIADPGNKNLMREFWIEICFKFNLYDEYKEVIEREIDGYLE